ncbi:MAG: WecB/TagA/CpsF family glycosyltransferase [Clostridiales bacterium]|jgi:N-acetylglucosaminyldiphosphoundecaprenol N-acetyl-beta-D-mannosaminyltransferase|nr:WecB/TagA/CpsF family glycosyltransferase [Clostridiales bacterium]
MRISILGVPVDDVTPNEALDLLMGFLGKDGFHLLVTPNPEMIMLAQKDPQYKEILQSADLVAPDGIGVVLAARMGGRPIRCRVTGCDLIASLLERLPETGATAYFLGAAPGVALKAKENMEKKFPGLRILGADDGYFDSEKEREILERIKELKPDLLMIGLSMGKAEKWASAHKDLPVRIAACIGGTIDVLGDKVKRAPLPFRKLGLEWFYRLLTQPTRARRMLMLPVFMGAILREYVFGKKKMEIINHAG